MIENWPEVVWSGFDLRNEFANRSGDPELLRLAARARAHLRDVPRPQPAPESLASPVISVRFRFGDQTISTFSSQLRFDSAQEVTTSELRLELIFPADPRSGEIIRWLAEAD